MFALIFASMLTFSVFSSGCVGLNLGLGGTQSSQESSSSEENVGEEESSEQESSSAEHVHTFDEEFWEKNDKEHWFGATCEHKDEVKDKAEHTWGEWYSVLDATCTEDGEEERMCEVCEQYDSRQVDAFGHTSDGSVYFIRGKHWEECEVCYEKLNVSEHDLDGEGCTVCEFKVDPNVYWNDGDNIEELRLSIPNVSKGRVIGYAVYSEELPAGYEGDARAFYKLEVNKPGNYWAVSALPGMDKSVYEQFKGKGYFVTSQLYFELPEAPTEKKPVMTFNSTMYKNLPYTGTQDQNGRPIYGENFDCATWYTLDFDLDLLLEHWDSMFAADSEIHRKDAMMMGRGHPTNSVIRVDMYWGDFKLVDKNGEEIPLTALK